MSKDYWRVEEKIYPIPKPNIQAEYIKLLERVTENLKKTRNTNMHIDHKGTTETLSEYAMPTVIFAEMCYPKTTDHGILKLHCYSDLREFWKVLEILDSGVEIE